MKISDKIRELEELIKENGDCDLQTVLEKKQALEIEESFKPLPKITHRFMMVPIEYFSKEFITSIILPEAIKDTGMSINPDFRYILEGGK